MVEGSLENADIWRAIKAGQGQGILLATIFVFSRWRWSRLCARAPSSWRISFLGTPLGILCAYDFEYYDPNLDPFSSICRNYLARTHAPGFSRYFSNAQFQNVHYYQTYRYTGNTRSGDGNFHELGCRRTRRDKSHAKFSLSRLNTEITSRLVDATELSRAHYFSASKRTTLACNVN